MCCPGELRQQQHHESARGASRLPPKRGGGRQSPTSPSVGRRPNCGKSPNSRPATAAQDKSSPRPPPFCFPAPARAAMPVCIGFACDLRCMTNNSTARGFEPLRAEPNGFLVHHLSHSVTLSAVLGGFFCLSRNVADRPRALGNPQCQIALYALLQSKVMQRREVWQRKIWGHCSSVAARQRGR